MGGSWLFNGSISFGSKPIASILQVNLSYTSIFWCSTMALSISDLLGRTKHTLRHYNCYLYDLLGTCHWCNLSSANWFVASSFYAMTMAGKLHTPFWWNWFVWQWRQEQLSVRCMQIRSNPSCMTLMNMLPTFGSGCLCNLSHPYAQKFRKFCRASLCFWKDILEYDDGQL